MFKSLEDKYPKFYQVFRFIIVIIASILYAWNLRCFAKVADLLPGGFSGVSLLLQTIGMKFFGINIPFTIFNVALNIVPAYIAYKYIGKKFTIYSIVVIILSSVLVDILPPYIFTEDILLINVDLPAFGSPKSPTSAINFNSNCKFRSIPGSPGSQYCGARFWGVQK